ncbi:hypothetical protein LOTGIDRAFT_188540 [Lottia gigantea]|uniref:EXPERA domain-containing protein n=1 Tax=Lottia gigantea TaxID=225164 RepID=V4AFY9_LOTGI|nr:hypothetical protein LOTGIDRAFT_188540 [Lottia gigantea]ESO95822.1 hypothetical protein LOTGIDRAFT_188540 [Lottia gigantea]
MVPNSSVKHPYYPQDIALPHYVPNDKELSVLLGGMFGSVGLFMVFTWFFSGRSKTKFSTTERLILCWFMMCGLIHTFLEGYFSLFHATIAGEMTFLAQVWKEYSKGDSRYLTSDTFVLCMESITAAIDGPLSFLALVAYFRQSSYRYILQLIVSICQLYGDVLYFMTEIKEGFSHGDHGHPLYFWFYFLFMNLIWIVVPICLIFHASSHLADSQSKADQSFKTGRNKKRH